MTRCVGRISQGPISEASKSSPSHVTTLSFLLWIQAMRFGPPRTADESQDPAPLIHAIGLIRGEGRELHERTEAGLSALTSWADLAPPSEIDVLGEWLEEHGVTLEPRGFDWNASQPQRTLALRRCSCCGRQPPRDGLLIRRPMTRSLGRTRTAPEFSFRSRTKFVGPADNRICDRLPAESRSNRIRRLRRGTGSSHRMLA